MNDQGVKSVRHLVYGLSASAMLAGAVGLALLPRVTMDWIWFGIYGAICSGAIAGGWVLAGATAGDWPRPRAGWMLMIGGGVGVAISLWRWELFPLVWAFAVWSHGLLFTVRLFPQLRRKGQNEKAGPVRPPVSRRQEGGS